jgi:branched-chain amino acid transport system ATP-binding protein
VVALPAARQRNGVTPILELKAVNKTFGAVVAASDISVAIARHSIVGLIGSNGAGKTTFVNLVTGYLKPASGAIEHEGRDITTLAPRRIARLGVSRSFQIPQLFDTLSVLENVQAAIGVAARAAPDGERITRDHDLLRAAEELLVRFGLDAITARPAGVLPEGLRKLLDIAMALAGRPHILLLDEPTSGVSADEKFGIMDKVMNAVRAERITVLFVEHDMEIVERYAERVLAFYEGRIIADGEPKQVLRSDAVCKYVIGEEPAHA